ncbi:MAG: (d)CMP kinase [Oscillospiraceae bacterium]|nr:(d)CMP kinase [Oscillospiraceae bacterium]
MHSNLKQVAIDGPSGAGKSTIAQAAARQLGWAYIDTGALYRAIGLAVMRSGANTKNEDAVAACLPVIELDVQYVNGEQQVYIAGENVSEAIRTPEASLAASDVGKVPAVRDFLLQLQRDLAAAQPSILDGRDIGTVVLPHAPVKIYLTASAEMRAQRRHSQLAEKGIDEPFEKVLAEVNARDEQDMNRAIAPLRQADDAVLLDTTHLSLDESIQAVVQLIRNAV